MLAKGYLAIVLHAHLPYVHHPEHEDFLEEDWFFEGLSETYLPLLDILQRLHQEQIPTHLTLALSPPLCSMFEDPLLRERFLKRLQKHRALAEQEWVRARHNKALLEVVELYHQRIEHQIRQYQKLNADLVRAFSFYQEQGMIEICTCSATHAFLPLMANHPVAVRAQIQVAVQEHTRLFGQAPKGIWLPECAYYPGLDQFLLEAGLRFFFLDSHGVTQAVPKPMYGVYAPIYTPTGMAVFGRDIESSKQVWSGQEGYPGDYDYRDFYRDIGYDRPIEEIHPYIQPTGARKNTGFKYHRITGLTNHKELYRPRQAIAKAHLHAEHFVQERVRQIQLCVSSMGRAPVIVAPYDAELFGHW
ncbi:MAG: DUF1957 domain-containing protein, partial [Myxococcota bacterium]